MKNTYEKLVFKSGFLYFWIHLGEEDQTAFTFVETTFMLPASLHMSSTHSLSEYTIVETHGCALYVTVGTTRVMRICRLYIKSTFISLWLAVDVWVFSRVLGCQLGKSTRLYDSQKLCSCLLSPITIFDQLLSVRVHFNIKRSNILHKMHLLNISICV